ncbi:MAG: glucose 1-dehydrogenase [Caldilineaceae bacterium]|nr:glucose 1-dehydrogenase [Caldilineaceae bacterium]MDE0339134.1 glucose 1-dehydrogenase [Caldilineaceae bacterium]
MANLPDFNLAGKVAVITGASRGIGEAIARCFAAHGAAVVLSSRKQAALDDVAESIRSDGGRALAAAAHTGDMAATAALAEQAVREFGGIDILVNNAATNPHFGPLLSAEESHWHKILDVNVVGYFRMAKSCSAEMMKRGGGKIINVASIAGKRPHPGMGVYSVSKAGVLMLTEVLAAELAAEGIQVNTIAPGYVRTAFSRAIWEDPDLNQTVLRAIPQKRIAETDEITGIALYLASAASSFTTGGTFVVDGGQWVDAGLGG